ncbi:response regulator transcription factor [Motilimonas pumila]|uniref:DNA-binding response regulator n=1 Tax=Motilimonas pumila TaxID=2303987 RepID=A0A418YFV7_9GAMM|nr:response regulator transcription factor [Motilimonas pumila]RJG48425.1 DNA-binding response regulator [Motilimonas pumila]
MSQAPHLFIVEDDPKLNQMLSAYFAQQGFKVSRFDDGLQAEQAIIKEQPSAVLLDLMLPGQDGLTLCRQIRPHYCGKVLMLTASDDDFDHVAALEIGADDFVNKPIKPRVLLARVRALLRRQDTVVTEQLEFGQLKLMKNRRLCQLAGQTINLTNSEFSLLWLLAHSADTVLSREQLTQHLRGVEYDGLDRTIDNKIVTLRKKLADNAATPQRIITVRGQGYLFVPDSWN